MSKQNYIPPNKTRSEFTKYDAFTDEPRPTREDMEALSENLMKLLNNSTESSGKKKMSYSISGLSQMMIKNTSEQYGVTQSSVIELAPFLFSMIAEKSLERRKNGLSTLHLLVKQIHASLTAFEATAPHLSAYTENIRQILGELLTIEENAIHDKNYHGADASQSEILSKISNTRTEPAYYSDVEDTIRHFRQIDSQFHYFKTHTGG